MTNVQFCFIIFEARAQDIFLNLSLPKQSEAYDYDVCE